MKNMTNVQKLMVIVQVFITKLKLKLTKTELFLIDFSYNKKIQKDVTYLAYNLRTKSYHAIANTPFVNDTINHGYKKSIVSNTIRAGKLVNNQVLLY